MIISDAGPLRYLVLLEKEELIARIFGSLLIPFEVADELAHQSAPPKVQNWIRNTPPWASIAPPGPHLVVTSELHGGELAAITLMERSPARLLLMDDLLGKQEAERRGLHTVGTVGVLFQAGVDGILNFEHVFDELLNTNFHLDRKTRLKFLSRWAEHQKTR